MYLSGDIIGNENLSMDVDLAHFMVLLACVPFVLWNLVQAVWTG